MNSITECLDLIASLTRKNLDILRTINESFHTKRSHLLVNVDDTQYVIPSFVSLESRIESMEQNLENIVNAPLTGEAFTYHDGTTQRIELSGYSTTPQHVELARPSTFKAEPNNIFKDFMNPNPFIRLGMDSIPNNIKHVNIRKFIIPDSSTELLDMISNIAHDGQVQYADLMKVLFSFTKDEDYSMYDTIKRLPLREGMAQGTYVIEEIINNWQDSNFDEYYELKLDKDPVYHINNGTIQRDIQVGDILVTYNDKVQLEVHSVNFTNRTIEVKVMYGAYADLQDKTSANRDLYTIKYYRKADDNAMRGMYATKYVDVSIEEDRHILVFVAPINDTTNIQAPWGGGIFLNTDELTIDIDGENIPFREYYDNYVNNVGDALASITSMMDDDEQISRLTPAEFEYVKNYQPEIDGGLIKVTQINKHLNDSKSIKAIRNLYKQKSQYKSDLDTVERSIAQVTKDLAELSFDDSSNLRSVYENQLSEYNNQRVELMNSIIQISQDIAYNANNSEVPIENAKYRIRGFVNVENLVGMPTFVKPIKIDVEYRYKNPSSFTGNAETIGDYIFSDWNKMDSIYRKRIPINNGITYKYIWENPNGDTNNPSFNQVDIPICQGEMVDIRVRFIYNLGYPFAEFTSAWSPVYTMEFPQEYLENVEILDIITENNDEIRQRTFERMLESKGLISHIDDELQDQTTMFKHHANNIASGFYTEERRSIPLYDKLFSMDNDIEDLVTEVYGATSENLMVTLSTGDNAIQLKPNIINNLHVGSYKSAISDGNSFLFDNPDMPDVDDPRFALAQLNIQIRNMGTHNMKLHTIFPGDHNMVLGDDTVSPFDISNYTIGSNGVFMMMDEKVGGELLTKQRHNQLLYFRTRVEGKEDLYSVTDTPVKQMLVSSDVVNNGIPVYSNRGDRYNVIEMQDATDNQSLYDAMMASDPGTAIGALYPYPGSLHNICMESTSSYIVLKPGESIDIPVNFAYWFQEATDDALVNQLIFADRNGSSVPTSDKTKNLRAALITENGLNLDFTDRTKLLESMKSVAATPEYLTLKQPFQSSTKMRNLTITRMMAFDIRTSLFRDPITYKFTVDASYEDTKGFKIKRVQNVASAKIPISSVVPQVGLTRVVSETPKLTLTTSATSMSGRKKVKR